jgi:Secretion system C-terminal sorting domain/Reeler domain
MQLRYSAFLMFLLLMVLAVGSANKNGRAATANKGNTGAPGDDMNANGFKITCQNCHNAGPITATMGIVMLDAQGDTVTTFTPGADYTIRVNIDGVGTTVSRYGFQMIPIRDSDNSDIKGMSDWGSLTSNNYKISNINSTNRTYAEHANASLTDTFNVRWKAPLAGTGSVTFYASGNAVNNNGGTSGDGAAVATLKVFDATVSTSTDEPLVESLKLFPNPVVDQVTLQGQFNEKGTYDLSVFNLQGQRVWSQQSNLNGWQQYSIPTSDWPAGVYLLQVRNEGGKLTHTKIVKQ